MSTATKKNGKKNDSKTTITLGLANKISIPELKAKCKQMDIKGYSKKKKTEIVTLLIDNSKGDPEIAKIALLAKTVKDLKKECKSLKLKGYSKKKKRELVESIYNTRKKIEKVNNEIEKLYSPNCFPDYLLTKELLKKCYWQIQKTKPDITIKFFLRHLKNYFDYIEKETIKIIVRRTKKCKREKVYGKDQAQGDTEDEDDDEEEKEESSEEKDQKEEEKDSQNDQSSQEDQKTDEKKESGGGETAKKDNGGGETATKKDNKPTPAEPKRLPKSPRRQPANRRAQNKSKRKGKK